MNQTIVAQPSDTVPPVRMVYPAVNSRIVFNFSAVLTAGDTISSFTAAVSGHITIASSSHSSTAVTINTTNTLLDGQIAEVACSITTTGSLQDARSVRLVAYDSGIPATE